VTIVEPGAFRTDFAGRSLTQSAANIDDYADTAGKRRKERDTVHGTQACDPFKAARRSSPPSNTPRRLASCYSAPTLWPDIAGS